MARHEVSCPFCQADIPLGGDERKGEEVYCTYCGAPCRLTGNAQDDDCGAVEDL